MNSIKNVAELIGKSVWTAFCEADDSIVDGYTWKVYETTRHNTLVEKCYNEGYNNTDEGKRIDSLIIQKACIRNNNVCIYAR